jgi:hypothetical protein
MSLGAWVIGAILAGVILYHCGRDWWLMLRKFWIEPPPLPYMVKSVGETGLRVLNALLWMCAAAAFWYGLYWLLTNT